MRNNSAAQETPRVLEFFDGQILYRFQNGHGEEIKFVSPSAVAAAFRHAPIDSGWLAPGVMRCGSTPKGDFAVLFMPAQKYSLEIEGRKRPLNVDLPSFIFFGYHKAYMVWSIKEKSFNPGAQLYRAPLPNVFLEGAICWGQNKPPRASAATITKAWQLFISSPFTSHAADSKSRSHMRDVRVLLAKLGNKPFPLNELVSNQNKLDRAISDILGGAYEPDGD